MADDRVERQHLYERAKDELVAAQRANAEQFDRAVLSLSAGFLALSVSFMKDVVPFSDMVHGWLLYLSWICFASVISLTLLGMLYGQRILKRLMSAAEQYYVHGKAEAWHLSETLPRRIDQINVAVGVLFAAAVFVTVLFVILNLTEREMSEKSGTVTPRVERGQPANVFPKIPVSPQQPAPSELPKAVTVPPQSQQQSSEKK
jgi:hypothetical protein